METKEAEMSRWLTVEEASRYLGCSRNFLDKDRVSRLHGIPYSRLGRHIRYDRIRLDQGNRANRNKVLKSLDLLNLARENYHN